MEHFLLSSGCCSKGTKVYFLTSWKFHIYLILNDSFYYYFMSPTLLRLIRFVLIVFEKKILAFHFCFHRLLKSNFNIAYKNLVTKDRLDGNQWILSFYLFFDFISSLEKKTFTWLGLWLAEPTSLKVWYIELENKESWDSRMIIFT